MAGGMKTYGKHRFPGPIVYSRGHRRVGKKHPTLAAAEVAGVRRLRRLFQRMEFFPAGPRGDETRQEEKDADADDIQFDSRHGLCRPHRAPHYPAFESGRGGFGGPLRLHRVRARRRARRQSRAGCGSFTTSRSSRPSDSIFARPSRSP